jgi:hypothetical protein
MSATKTFDQNHLVTRDDLRTTETGHLYSDQAAVAICMRDSDTCDAYITANNWATRWTDSDSLLQSPQSTSLWGQGIGTRACVPNFMLSDTLDAIVPKIVGGLLYEDPPFLLRPRPGTTQDTIRAKTAIFSYQLEDMRFAEAIEDGVFDMGLLGTVCYKWGWHEEPRKHRKFKRKSDPQILKSAVGYETVIHTEDSDAIEFEYVEYQTRRPYIEKKYLSRVTPDPACKSQDWRTAKWVRERSYVDWDDLEYLRGLPDYNIPSKETLLTWFFTDKKTAGQDNVTMTMPEGMRAFLVHSLPTNYPTSADPLRASLELIERQDANSIICVLRHGTDCILIRNSENPFAEIARMAGGTGHTYLSCGWRKIPDSPFGQSLGQIVGTRQMVAQGTENLALEVAAYPLHPTFTRVKGWNTQTQQIDLSTGDVLEVEGDDVRKGIGLLEMPKVPPEVWQILKYNKSESMSGAGTDQNYGMGTSSAGIQTSGTRSSAGAQLKGQALASRLDGPIERFVRQVFEPCLYIMDNLNNELLPTADMRKILTDRGMKDDKGNPLPFTDKTFNHIEYRNAEMDYEVLAGAHLGPKREMTQFLSVIEQIAINPALLQAAAEADMTFNFEDWFKSFADLSGFKFSQDFFTKMTAEQKKRRDANSAAALQAQKSNAAQQQMQQQNNSKTQQIFDSALARAGEKTTVLQAEHALQLGTETPGVETLG